MSVTYGQNQRNQWRHPVPFDESEAAQNLRSMPFWEYIHTWLANIRSRVSEDTWYSYYSNCARVVEYFQEMHPEVTLGTFSAQDIIEFDNYMSTVVSERTNQKLSSTYRRRLHGLISAAINEAMYQGIVSFNPVHNVKAPRGKTASRPVYFLEEIITLLEAMKGSPGFIPALLICICGLRGSEAAGLEWSYVHFSDKVIHISQAKSSRTNELHPYVKTKDSDRILPMVESLSEVLWSWKCLQEDNRAFLKSRAYYNDFVCTWPDGKPMTGAEIRTLIRFGEEQAHLKPVSPHRLRHSAACIMLKNNFNVVEVQHMLGHRNPDITLSIYLQMFSVAIPDVGERLNQIYAESFAKFDIHQSGTLPNSTND